MTPTNGRGFGKAERLPARILETLEFDASEGIPMANVGVGLPLKATVLSGLQFDCSIDNPQGLDGSLNLILSITAPDGKGAVDIVVEMQRIVEDLQAKGYTVRSQPG